MLVLHNSGRVQEGPFMGTVYIRMSFSPLEPHNYLKGLKHPLRGNNQRAFLDTYRIIGIFKYA